MTTKLIFKIHKNVPSLKFNMNIFPLMGQKPLTLS